MIEVIDNHSVRTDLLKGFPVLDAGARGWRFSRWFKEHQSPSEIYACDPAPDIEVPSYVTHFDRVALISTSWDERFSYVPARREVAYGLVGGPDPEAWYVHRGAAHEIDIAIVPGWTIDKWPFRFHEPADIIKLNIEGCEYDVLAEWPGPIARQITVSFHEHCHPRGRARIDAIVEHLSQWYVPLRHEEDERYCAGKNFWDSLFVLKGLA